MDWLEELNWIVIAKIEHSNERKVRTNGFDWDWSDKRQVTIGMVPDDNQTNNLLIISIYIAPRELTYNQLSTFFWLIHKYHSK